MRDRYGVKILGAPGTVFNMGYIHASPSAFGQDGVYMTDGGVVINGASGGTVSAAYIHGYTGGVKFGAGGAGTLTNYGTISGLPGNPSRHDDHRHWSSTDQAAQRAPRSGGVDYGILISGAGTVINYATISAAAIRAIPGDAYGSAGRSGSVPSATLARSR